MKWRTQISRRRQPSPARENEWIDTSSYERSLSHFFDEESTNSFREFGYFWASRILVNFLGLRDGASHWFAYCHWATGFLSYHSHSHKLPSAASARPWLDPAPTAIQSSCVPIRVGALGTFKWSGRCGSSKFHRQIVPSLFNPRRCKFSPAIATQSESAPNS